MPGFWVVGLKVTTCCPDPPFQTKVHIPAAASSFGFWQFIAVSLPRNGLQPKGAAKLWSHPILKGSLHPLTGQSRRTKAQMGKLALSTPALNSLGDQLVLSSHQNSSSYARPAPFSLSQVLFLSASQYTTCTHISISVWFPRNPA